MRIPAFVSRKRVTIYNIVIYPVLIISRESLRVDVTFGNYREPSHFSRCEIYKITRVVTIEHRVQSLTNNFGILIIVPFIIRFRVADSQSDSQINKPIYQVIPFVGVLDLNSFGR